MSRSNILAVDAMGGDNAPDVIIAGLEIAAVRHPLARFLLFGDEAVLAPLVAKTKRLKIQSTLHHASGAIAGDMKPTIALRMRDSSMRRAIDAVQHNEAAGVISAGNTGALLALSKIVLKTMQGIDRPAMAATAPSAKGDVVMLDLGLNVVCDSRNLVEFALMGEMFAKIVLGLPAPTIGLLNVGSEEGKGNEILRVAASMLRESPIGAQFHGFIEGHDITAGTVNVIVTDGFTGNVVLKTAEGVAELLFGVISREARGSLTGKVGGALLKPKLRPLRDRVDYRKAGGALLLGVAGEVVIAHGRSDAEAIGNAVRVAALAARQRVSSRIAAAMASPDRAATVASVEHPDEDGS